MPLNKRNQTNLIKMFLTVILLIKILPIQFSEPGCNGSEEVLHTQPDLHNWSIRVVIFL